MFYNLVRYIITGVFLLIAFIIVKKLSLSKKKAIFAFVAAYIISVVISGVPFENVFFTFDSPEQAFEYSERGEILMVSEAEESSIVAYKKDNKTYSHFVVYKENGGYKLANEWSLKRIHHKSTETLKFTIYKIDGTQDYFLTVFGFASENEVLTDSNSKVFDLRYEVNDGLYRYYSAFAIDYSSQYKLYFNGETIVFE